MEVVAKHLILKIILINIKLLICFSNYPKHLDNHTDPNTQDKVYSNANLIIVNLQLNIKYKSCLKAYYKNKHSKKNG